MPTATINLELERLIRSLPGYDPYDQAGDCWFDEAEAQFRIGFIETHCSFTQGIMAGQPFRMLDWEKAVCANMWGWKRPDGLRRYRVVLVIIGRGNGKSEWAAAEICSSMFVPDHPPEPGGHVYSLAGKKDQTIYVSGPVRTMIRANPELNSKATVQEKAVVVAGRPYWALSREVHTGTGHGGAPAFAVADELHAHIDRRLIHAVETGMPKRKQPLFLCISTADFERPESPCNQMQDYAQKVCDNTIEDPTFLPALFVADKEDDWTSPATWAKANPSMGVTIQEGDLAALCSKAKADPAFENEFKRLHCNIRTDASSVLIGIEQWDACKGVLPALSGKRCWCAVDLGATSDLTAFAAAYLLDDDRVGLEFRVWVPEKIVRDREQRGNPQYATWCRQGFMTMTPGAVVDYAKVEADIVAFAEEREMQELAADTLFQGAQLIQNLVEGHGLPAFEHRQGHYGMALPMRTFMEQVNQGKILHDGNPVARWGISNLVGTQDAAGNWKPDKKKSTDKIDPVVAAVMAVGRAVTGDRPQADYYDAHPVRGVV
jgi:phage terminase large subunit-like protein